MMSNFSGKLYQLPDDVIKKAKAILEDEWVYISKSNNPLLSYSKVLREAAGVLFGMSKAEAK